MELSLSDGRSILLFCTTQQVAKKSGEIGKRGIYFEYETNLTIIAWSHKYLVCVKIIYTHILKMIF